MTRKKTSKCKLYLKNKTRIAKASNLRPLQRKMPALKTQKFIIRPQTSGGVEATRHIVKNCKVVFKKIFTNKQKSQVFETNVIL